MVTKTTKTTAKAKTTSKKRPVAKKAAAKKQPATRGKVKAAPTEDYYPNKVPFLVAVAAAVLLVLLATITSQ